MGHVAKAPRMVWETNLKNHIGPRRSETASAAEPSPGKTGDEGD